MKDMSRTEKAKLNRRCKKILGEKNKKMTKNHLLILVLVRR